MPPQQLLEPDVGGRLRDLGRHLTSDIENRIGAKQCIAVQARSMPASLELARIGPCVVFAGRPSLNA